MMKNLSEKREATEGNTPPDATGILTTSPRMLNYNVKSYSLKWKDEEEVLDNTS